MVQVSRTTLVSSLVIGITQAAGIRKTLYKPKPAGPQITGTLTTESQSSSTPQYGGWIKFNVDIEGMPENGELTNGSKILINTVCQQDFYDTVDISEEYDGSGTYMLFLNDSELNRGEDKPWKQYYSALCQTKLLYRYRFQDLYNSIGTLDYFLDRSHQGVQC